ncbi:hypothetical protein [Croceicoccus pelagius]|uniref:mannitol dehydrogenase family protein n=1 Tax=Croceicoccus pelagius TaxID=1703341 RepID=UPI001E461E03|nr:hypothetical protein [Croceicoccus pelagius]
MIGPLEIHRRQDLEAYADKLRQRFADPALNHRLAQIAMDGTQKIPQRWLDTAAWHAERCGRTKAIVSAFDAWIDHVGASEFVDDPARNRLIAAYAVLGRKGVLDLCFGSSEDSPLWPDRAALRGLFE